MAADLPMGESERRVASWRWRLYAPAPVPACQSCTGEAGAHQEERPGFRNGRGRGRQKATYLPAGKCRGMNVQIGLFCGQARDEGRLCAEHSEMRRNKCGVVAGIR